VLLTVGRKKKNRLVRIRRWSGKKKKDDGLLLSLYAEEEKVRGRFSLFVGNKEGETPPNTKFKKGEERKKKRKGEQGPAGEESSRNKKKGGRDGYHVPLDREERIGCPLEEGEVEASRVSSTHQGSRKKRKDRFSYPLHSRNGVAT